MLLRLAMHSYHICDVLMYERLYFSIAVCMVHCACVLHDVMSCDCGVKDMLLTA